MKITIFANKYRGFEDLEFTIDKNIFLVGDNSTGKSSIIHLINFVLDTQLSSPPSLDERYSYSKYDFFSPYFNYADVTIGAKFDIDGIVIHKSITIKRRGETNEPTITKFAIMDNDVCIIFKKNRNNYSYYISKNDSDGSIEYFKSKVFGNQKYKKLDGNVSENPINSIYFLIAVYQHIISKEKKYGRALSSGQLLNAPKLRCIHIGPMRGLPERYYAYERKRTASGSHFVPMMHDISGAIPEEIKDFVLNFGQESKLFNDFEFKKISESTETSPIVATVTINGKKFIINQVGIGVSQAFPILIESIYALTFRENSFILLQQPEIHLHPIAQAAMGEFVYQMSNSKNIYVVETHSDFFIDRFRKKMRDKKNNPAKIIFCTNDNSGNHYSIINIDDDGTINTAPEEYRSFFIKELIDTMF